VSDKSPLYLEGGLLIGSYQLIGDGGCIAYINHPGFKKWLEDGAIGGFSIDGEETS